MDDSPSSNTENHQIPHMQTIQTLNQSTDVNFSIESIFATEQQMPQLSFMTDDSDTITNSSAHTLCESAQENSNHDLLGSGLFSKSKANPPPKLDFSSFNITEELPNCAERAAKGRCCKNNVLPEVPTEINTPNPIKIDNYNENPFDMIQSQAVQMAIASEVEMPAPWVDVTVLATKAVIPTSVAPDTNCLALPTGIPSYVDLQYQMSTATASTSMHSEQKVSSNNYCTNPLDSENPFLDEVMSDQTDNQPMTKSKQQLSINTDVLDGNIVDALLSEANQMYNNPHIQTTAQQIEADSILSEILRSIDNVHQTTAQMAKEAAARQGSNGFVPRPASVLPQLTNLSATFGPSSSATITPATSLETITAEADICSCGSNCMCDQMLGCQGGCGPLNPCRDLPPAPPPSMDIDIDSAAKSSNGCCGGDSCGKQPSTSEGILIKRNPPIAAVRPKSLNSLEAKNLISSLVTSACCSPEGTDKSHLPPKPSCGSSAGGGCTCKSPMEGIANGCCVVICLKTLEQLRSLLNSSTINLIRCSGSSGGVT